MKKSKKDKKKRKHEEEEQEEVPVKAEEQTEEEPKEKKKKSKKIKKESSDAEAEPASAATSSALSDLADELMMSKSSAADDEPIDLLALNKNKKNSKTAMHASRAGADDAARVDAASFKPDANAEVISDKVRLFLGNLPFKITDELIHDCFDEFGTIAGIHWVTDKATGE